MEREDSKLTKFSFINDDSECDGSILTPGVYYPRKKLTNKSRKSPKIERIVQKNGDFNVEKPNGSRHSLGCVFNCFVTFVDAQWRWTLLYFCMGFTGDWLFFATLYYMIAIQHGDLVEENLPTNHNGTWTPCIDEIYGFTSTFLFSVEVHTTLAYGRRSITLECPEAIFTMCMQCIASSFLQAFMVGILFAKLTRPKGRTQTILFSKNAVISYRDEKLCLQFRVGDVRTSRILNVNVSTFLLKVKDDDKDGFEQIELKVDMDECEPLFFMWPLNMVHVINECSPLYDVSAADLLCANIEVLVVFEGIIESTGQPIQARTSYTEAEILWGNRFVSMVEYNCSQQAYDVNFRKFDETEKVEAPLCSAKEFGHLSSAVKSLISISNVRFYCSDDDESLSN